MQRKGKSFIILVDRARLLHLVNKIIFNKIMGCASLFLKIKFISIKITGAIHLKQTKQKKKKKKKKQDRKNVKQKHFVIFK